MKDRKDPRKHIEAINISYMQSSEKANGNISNKAIITDGGRTSGRWTAEEHRKFVEALKRFGKQWKKVEDYIKTRSGAQIRSHAQKYFLKIQKEYPDQDAFLIFKNNSPEFLEETISMKNRNDSEEDKSELSLKQKSQNSNPADSSLDQAQEVSTEKPKAQGFDDNEFANSVKLLLKQRKVVPKEDPQMPPQIPPQIPSQNPHYQDILQIRNFYEHVQKVLPSGNLPPLNQVATGNSFKNSEISHFLYFWKSWLIVI